MPEISLKVDNDVGLHARPAALFVQTAARFKDATVEVQNGTATCDAKSILQLLTLGVGPGTTITVRAEGGQAEEALGALRTLVESNFAEG
ncbi:MAG TPA: HPr family phosphocarrier protein [Candidatus Binatia bacterium]|jgi:phosphotransferase system HPr (HPr) family protein|nr:HPr family phosphocarrier protein [Candidatus Binatia bacterium]